MITLTQEALFTLVIKILEVNCFRLRILVFSFGECVCCKIHFK